MRLIRELQLRPDLSEQRLRGRDTQRMHVQQPMRVANPCVRDEQWPMRGVHDEFQLRGLTVYAGL
jgi:hypothetical protein